MRKAIAKRLVESLHTIAQSSGSYEADVTELLAFREKLVQREAELGTRITVTDLVSLALLRALGEHPDMNAFMTETEMIYHDYINLGVAVSLPNGLVTVVVKGADKMSLVELSRAMKALAAKARAKKLTMEDISDATFTMSSLGPHSAGGVGIPLVSTPQAGIVQFGASLRKPIVIDEQIVIRSLMRINVSYDHRIVDGAEVSRFNQCLRRYIENLSWVEV
jgi:pyruvate dehydrogenase E2 component (dihydrolipoamide acetyltransferase)